MLMDLTIAICVYNAEKYLNETLDSLMNQTVQDFKLLIVNDCSTDKSVEVIKDFFKKYPRQYEIVDFEENRGICYARHFAERHAKTQYMMFLDADDILLPHAIETMWNKIQSDPDLMAVGCYLDYIDENSKKIGGGLYIGETSKEKFIRKAEAGKLIFMQPTAIYNREDALSVGGYVVDGYPEGKPRYQDFCEDLDLWTRMSDLYIYGKAIVVVPDTLCLYRKGGGLSGNTLNMMIKMRYTKSNVRRRRRGGENIAFADWVNTLEYKELWGGVKLEAAAAESLRNGVLLLRRHSFAKGIYLIFKSVFIKPSYLFDKLKHNYSRRG